MRTDHVEIHLPDYINGTLDPPLLPWVEEHLQECEECRAEVEELRGTMSALRRAELKSPHDGYFTTVLPRVRERLDDRKGASKRWSPLVTRFAAPLVAGALLLAIFLRSPLAVRDTAGEHNPLQPVVHGLEAEELVDMILDQVQHQTISSAGENETSALLAVPYFHSDHLLAGAEHLQLADESILDVGIQDNLDQLSASEVDVLVAQLGERTKL